ncbi:MAG: cyclic nucleotide-binding domain-containing protein [Chthoniobacterales bacterium]
MGHRDFFAYCTTLKPLELKAIGEFSYVQHLASGRIVYSAGDASSTFYVVTRGMVELSGGEAIAGVDVKILGRGQFFGDLETLTAEPRRHTARARHPLSIQCFQRDDFPEIFRRVPSFFYFLSQDLATRLYHAEAAASAADPESFELHGNLANFDLITVYQTIVSSRQSGELRIFNEKADLISVFSFENGEPRNGQFQHLTGDEAFTQLFLAETLAGSFLFSLESRVSSCIQTQVITATSDMLIRALQARDELLQLKTRFADSTAMLLRRKLNITWPDDAPSDARTTAEQIWQLAYSTPLPISALYQRCQVSELKIYEALAFLVDSGHFELSTASADCAQVA